jgi:hypothetical protein
MTDKKLQVAAIGLITLVSAITPGGAPRKPFGPRERAYYADAATVDFVRPGLIITINSAKIAADGTITTTYTVTDLKGLPLDVAGINTPGAISLSFVAATFRRTRNNTQPTQLDPQRVP